MNANVMKFITIIVMAIGKILMGMMAMAMMVMAMMVMGIMAMGKIVMSGLVASFRDRAERLSITCLQFDGSTNW